MQTIETHMSTVFLDTDRVYKILKPVQFPFADFSTPELREAACHDELAHNRPWAPGVYLSVVGIAGVEGSRPVVAETPDQTVDHAIVMQRLPDEARLSHRANHLDGAAIERVGRAIAAVHAEQPVRDGTAASGAVRKRIVDNLQELVALEGPTTALSARVSNAVHHRLDAVQPELEARTGMGRLLHGDLRAEHVYLLGDAEVGESNEVRVLDGVAFNEALAVGDPTEDVAFLVMDLTASHGRWDLEAPLWKAAAIDASPALRDLYVAHRALIRAKVALLTGRPERATKRLVFALSRLEAPMHRPALVAIGGLPGVGKSVLAKHLEEVAGFEVLRSDVVRKQGEEPDYSDAGRTRVYDRLHALAEARLARGGRVLLDASYSKRSWRSALRQLAIRAELRPTLLIGQAPEDVVQRRLAERVGDASDADFGVYLRAKRDWEAVTPELEPYLCRIDTGGTPEAMRARALAVLDLAEGA